MALLLDCFLDNFITLSLLAGLTVMIIINRKLAVPATGSFISGIVVLLLLSVVNSVRGWLDADMIFAGKPDAQYQLEIVITAASYVLRPLVIMIEAFVVMPNKKYRIPCMIPAAINAAVYLSMCFGTNADVLIDPFDPWHKGIVGFTIYYTELFYLFCLMMFSIIFFKWAEMKHSGIVVLMIVQSILVSVLEEVGVFSGYSNAVFAFCLVEYYFYLSAIYQKEMQAEVAKKELMLAQQKLTMLRSQIHPHFILNSLSIIRSLVKRDTKKAVSCIDDFADYLNIHVRAFRFDEIITFEEELQHVRAYLSLVRADTARQIEVEYQLETCSFKIPPLTLEPLIENAVKYGTGKAGGVIRISTFEEENYIVITVADSGADSPPSEEKKKSTGVGIENIRVRLAMLCGGKLSLERQPEGGMTAAIRIPKIKEESV